MRTMPRGLALLLLAALTAAFTGRELYRELTRGPEAIPPLPGPVGAPESGWLGELPAYDPPPLDAFEAVLAKPLFSPTRRPPEIVDEIDAPVASDRNPKPRQQQLNAKLLGVVGSGTKTLAILRLPDQPTAVHVARGGDLLGWTLKDLGPDWADFERDGQTVTLILDFVP